MNLAIIEDHLLRALASRIGRGVEWRSGPVVDGPATGMRAQVFVHAAAFSDFGGITGEGTHIARAPLDHGGGIRGFSEHRPGAIDVEVSCITAQHGQSQVLAGMAAPVLLEAVETLAPVLLSDPSDTARRLRFGDHRAHLRSVRSQALATDTVVAAQVVLCLRITGFLHVVLARKGGLIRQSAYQGALRLDIVAGQEGSGVRTEHVVLHNDGDHALDLGGWVLQDAAGRPHVYAFAANRRLGPGQAVRLWSGRGTDDAHDIYWGRRQAVWNNHGDVAVLRDPEGVERARATWSPPLPEPRTPKPRTGRPR